MADCIPVRPRFGNNVVINDGRHPLLDNSIGDKTVPNDTYIPDHSRTMIITGPNMSGKSTYLKQICQLCILAQSGCLIPAKVAVLPVFQRIFSRVGHNDSLVKNLSAFALEMDEIAFILQYSNDRTLVVIDELARSTSTEEGIGISFAIIEKFLKQKAFTIFATHFLDLAALGVNCCAVENYHFPPQVVYVKGQEQFCPTHRLHKGPYNGPLYGFELVELSTFPKEVVESARTLAQRLHEESANKRVVNVDTLMHNVIIRSAHSLRQACESKELASRESLIKCLKDIRRRLQINIAEAKTIVDEK
ncbi:hypothetical protein KIN20_016824 [Parelaphostrongylus tenuis]|uniref:DNA mismatch repair proteins mutS family domain-containing protein n=1 Tax=Parelaphostrongylus tenuis TaxID=148309 RepID=A0AAD5QTE5_PARTN|nr:hypothetical protein KIN20_016824 [Parelaphostrongylus tenuis]